MKDVTVDLNCEFKKLNDNGWFVVPSVFDHQDIDKVVKEYYDTKHIYEFYHKKKGIEELVQNASHHTYTTAPSIWDLVDNKILETIVTNFFGGPGIINTMGLSEVTGKGVYTQNIHRDVRTNTGDYPLYLNTLIMLDDSTEDNGATWLMEGSQQYEKKPEKGEFFTKAVRATGRKGDLLVFNCNLWHCAGENTTQYPRKIITPFFSRPFIKQQLDIPRFYGEDFGQCVSPRIKQFMGYNARIPTSLGEFYQKNECRFYKSGQG